MYSMHVINLNNKLAIRIRKPEKRMKLEIVMFRNSFDKMPQVKVLEWQRTLFWCSLKINGNFIYVLFSKPLAKHKLINVYSVNFRNGLYL